MHSSSHLSDGAEQEHVQSGERGGIAATKLENVVRKQIGRQSLK